MTAVKKSLIQIINEKDDMLAEIAASEGEVSNWVGELLSQNKEEERTKIENYSLVMNEFELQAAHFKKLAELFEKRSRSYHGLIKRLKEHLKFVMLHDGRDKIEGITCEFKLRRTKGTIVTDDLNLEEMHKSGSIFVTATTVYSVDKEHVREAIEFGEPIPWAKIEDGWSLSCTEIKSIEALKVSHDKSTAAVSKHVGRTRENTRKNTGKE